LKHEEHEEHEEEQRRRILDPTLSLVACFVFFVSFVFQASALALRGQREALRWAT
jgi:hypothetical protein